MPQQFAQGLKSAKQKNSLFLRTIKKLQTDRKSVNFHSEKRNNRFQVDRQLAHSDSDIINNDTEDSETAENNAVEIENTDNEKNETKGPEVETEVNANTQSKKTARLKIHERMREQRQRDFLDERHDSKNTYSQYYNDDFADLEDYDSYSNNASHEDYADTQPSKLATDTDTVMASYRNKDDGTYKDKPADTAIPHQKDEITKSFNADNSDKLGKLKSNKKTQGLKQEKK